ncbi:MAG: PIN domain-containing protein [Patescibacteria group bacterium]
MIFIDASFYLSLLNSVDSNHERALELGRKFQDREYVTTQMVLGEVLTVGSMRYDKELTIKFVEKILQSKTRILLEQPELIKKAFLLFKTIKSKNTSWVDCYSFAVIEKLRIQEALTFDKDFKKHA